MIKTVAKFLLLLTAYSGVYAATVAPEPIKAVVVTMFEHGEATGDQPGELQYWLEGSDSYEVIPFDAGGLPLYRIDDGVLVVNTGMGIANATATTMALVLDPRFDFSQAYWLIAGISGGDPQDTSLGSAVWAEHVVDGDLLYEIDAREIPQDWQYGLLPLGGKQPNDQSELTWTVDTIVYHLNSALAQWAFKQSKGLTLKDTPALKRFRQQFISYPKARQAPHVMMGDSIASSTYWHGRHLNQWANDWMRLHGGDTANFVTSAMEDTGTLTALARASRYGAVDLQRVMVLRTVSNYTLPPKNKVTAWSTTAEYPDNGEPAVHSAWAVGKTVIDALLATWDTAQHVTPQ